MKSLFKFSGLKNSPPIERTQIVEEDAALVSWYEETLDVFTHFSHRLWKDRWSTKIKPCLCVNIIRCSTVHLVHVRAEFVQCLILGLENSSWQWRRHITDLHRGPFFIIFRRLSLSDVKFVSTKVSLVRLKDEKCETSPLRVVYRYPFAYSHGIWIETCVIKFLCESFWLHHFLVIFQINTVSEKSQILIKVVSKAPSLCSRFRPTIDSAESSGPWRPHCHNTGRTGKWDTEKNGYFNNAHLQCNHLREWINAWVCECRRYFRSFLTPRIHGSSDKHYMGWSCSWSWWKKDNFEAFRKKTFFSIVCMNFFTPCRQECLVLHESPEVWMNVNFQ